MWHELCPLRFTKLFETWLLRVFWRHTWSSAKGVTRTRSIQKSRSTAWPNWTESTTLGEKPRMDGWMTCVVQSVVKRSCLFPDSSHDVYNDSSKILVKRFQNKAIVFRNLNVVETERNICSPRKSWIPPMMQGSAPWPFLGDLQISPTFLIEDILWAWDILL